jgi:hypothetical protein
MLLNLLISGGWVLFCLLCLWVVRCFPLNQNEVEMRLIRVDTPWDEPSENSQEFMAYLSQEIFDFDPWTRIRGQAKGM